MAFPTRLQQLIEEGRASIRAAGFINIPGVPYRFWSGSYDVTFEGQTFRANQIIQAAETEGGLGMEAGEFTLEMPETGDWSITPDVLKTIDTLAYKGAPVTLYDLYLDPDTRSPLYLDALCTGYVDLIEHVREGGEAKLIVRCMDKAVDNHRDGYRAANHEDQQLISPGDMFFEHAGRVKFEEFDIKFD